MDVKQKAIELCVLLANSFCDRDTKSPILFSKHQIEVAESFLLELIGKNMIK